MAYRSFEGGSGRLDTRLDTPPSINRRHPDSCLAPDAGTGGTSESPDPVYVARISLDRTEMQIEDKLVSLSPGMAVTVEIKTGSRSVISYLLSPLRKYKQESLRER